MLDLRGLSWGTTREGGLSYGCYYKASRVEHGHKYYYKCSNFYEGQQLFGDESVNEVICSRFLSLLGFDCVTYSLVDALVTIQGRDYRTFVCRSRSFLDGYDERITLEELVRLHQMPVMDVIIMYGLGHALEYMLVADFLVLQRDRHGGNIELLKKSGSLRMSPLFDNGLALLAPYPSSFGTSVDRFDVLADYPVNNYIGSRSLYSNLGLVNHPIHVKRLKKEDKDVIFSGLTGVLPIGYVNKIWELLCYRYYFLRKRGVIFDS